MTDRTEILDRAILKGMMAVGGHPSNDGQRRTYARTLIADLLRDMDDPPLDPPAILGWDLALMVIKRRAGLEGEG